ncbi:MAG TPA: heme ABC exporter ATP-binding protein CcmA [Hyphomicrobiaceae bacterium]|jgi:heme exporter protein A
MKLIGEELCARRGGRVLFAALSFAVDSGRALLVTGPNGAGKTTLLRTLAGFLRPEAGRVLLEGGAADAGIAEQCHYVGHANAVKPSLTVAESAAFWGGYLGGTAEDRLEAALDAFGLAALRDIPAGYLSAGQRRRAGLMRLLLAERPVWLLDEPTASLDEAAQGVLAGAVNRHLSRGGLVVAATHLPLAFDRAQELRLGPPAAAAA